MSQFDQFINKFRSIADVTPDKRTGKNIHYSIGDITSSSIRLLNSVPFVDRIPKQIPAGWTKI
jgi:hypothetical protein